MSIDKSLKTGGGLSKHRNVLKRAERIAKLQDDGRWTSGQSPFGLIKVAHRLANIGGKVKKKAETAATAEGEQTSETPEETEKK